MQMIRCNHQFYNIGYLISMLFLCTLMGCGSDEIETSRKSEAVEEKSPVISSFNLFDSIGNSFNAFLMDDSIAHIKVPNGYDLSHMGTCIEGDFTYVIDDSLNSVDCSFLNYNDFAKPHNYLVISSGGKTKKIESRVYDLPVLIIDTPERKPIVSKTERLEGCVVRYVDENGEINNLGTAGVRGRGNTTWTYPKKPYNIKFDKKVGFWGCNESKHWILMSNPYFDRSQLRNAIAYEMAGKTDYSWVQKGDFVELILNGTHQGLYYLCEKIRAEKGRIDFLKYKGEGNIKDYGWILESYVRLKTDTVPLPYGYFTSGVLSETGNPSRVLNWEIKEPDLELVNNEHVYIIKRKLQEVERLIRDSAEYGTYRKWFDIESAINWWIVEMACGNAHESGFTKNCYLYREGGVFYVGPPWDFDTALVRWKAYRFPTEDLSNALYFRYLFKDKEFVARLKEKWRTYKKIWETTIPSFIDEKQSSIKRAAERNEAMWSDWYFYNEYPELPYTKLVEETKESLLMWWEKLDLIIEDF